MGRLERTLLLTLLVALTNRAWAEIPLEVKQALASRDYAGAAAWLQAHRGEPDAAFELGKLYRLGKGVPQDQAEAMALFETAGHAGSTDARYLLGKLYERQGEADQAEYWMSLAASAGHPAARDWLADHDPVSSDDDLFASIRAGRTPPQTGPAPVSGEVDEAGRGLLHVAAGAGSVPWIGYLLHHGADPNARDGLGATPLHLALAGRQLEAAGLLLDGGADPSIAARDGTTALHLAVTGGASALAGRMLTMGADADAENDAGWTPRLLAKRSDDASLHRLFGVKTAGRDAVAVARSHEDALRLAQQAARRADGKTLERLLQTRGRAAVDVNELSDVLLEAAAGGRADVLGLLVRSGIDLAAVDGQQRTALMLSAQAGCTECVELLVRSGARTADRDPQGRTPLMLAAREGQLPVVDYLAAQGVPLDPADGLGRNALWWACRADHTAVAQRLLQLDVPIRADSEGLGPVHLAAANDDGELVAALAKHIGLEEPTGDGSRPLMIAARAGAGDAVAVLLAAGVDVKARNDRGDTALIVAVRAGHLAVTEQLLKAGANPRTRNDRFESAASLMAARTEPGWDDLLKSSEKGLFGLFGSL